MPGCMMERQITDKEFYRALNTGIFGQGGAYLTQLLLEKGYKVYGAYRRISSMIF